MFYEIEINDCVEYMAIAPLEIPEVEIPEDWDV